LPWYDLVPIVSFLYLGGRCRNCKSKVSWQYPLVELATGLVFAGLFLKFESLFFFSGGLFAITYAYYAAMFSLLIVIAVYDLKHKIVPDMLAFALGICTFIGLFFFSSDYTSSVYLHVPGPSQILAGFVVSVPFAMFWFLSRGRWMGLGDAKLAVGLGFLLGMNRVITGAVLSFWIGALAGILLLIFSKKHKMKTEIPFAPFLVLGAILAFIFEIHLFPLW
jgi:leader peptidase (prepilin peptidase)/N-methyltransferase